MKISSIRFAMNTIQWGTVLALLVLQVLLIIHSQEIRQCHDALNADPNLCSASAFTAEVASTNLDGDMTSNVKDKKKSMFLRWDYDVLIKSEEELKCMIRYSFEYYGVKKVEALDAMIDVVQKAMPENPFHNFHHVSAVVHSSFVMLALGGADKYLTKEEALVVQLAGLFHDLYHPGHDNAMEVKMQSKYAKKYHNESVLENVSIDAAVNDILREYGFEFMSENFDTISHSGNAIEALKQLILYTDMKKHNEVCNMLEGFTKRCLLRGDNGELPLASDRRILMFSLLHIADLSNTAHPDFEVARKWAGRIREEFKSQAKAEIELNLPVNPMMTNLDDELSMASGQVAFIQFIRSIFLTIGTLTPALQTMSERLANNLLQWDEITRNN